jgi:hypothetical protein
MKKVTVVLATVLIGAFVLFAYQTDSQARRYGYYGGHMGGMSMHRGYSRWSHHRRMAPMGRYGRMNGYGHTRGGGHWGY